MTILYVAPGVSPVSRYSVADLSSTIAGLYSVAFGALTSRL